MDKYNKKVDKINETIVFYVASGFKKNFQNYKQLFNNDMLYITYAEEVMGINEYVLNIGYRYRVCVVKKSNINSNVLKHILTYIAVLLCDFVVINKIQNINEGISELDVALDLGKDIYAIPGNIFEYENYLANFSIKQGAIPICSKYDAKYILKEKKFNLL